MIFFKELNQTRKYEVFMHLIFEGWVHKSMEELYLRVFTLNLLLTQVFELALLRRIVKLLFYVGKRIYLNVLYCEWFFLRILNSLILKNFHAYLNKVNIYNQEGVISWRFHCIRVLTIHTLKDLGYLLSNVIVEVFKLMDFVEGIVVFSCFEALIKSFWFFLFGT